jgi:hypothetical protein
MLFLFAFQIIITTPMELLKIQLQDAGRVVATLKAAGQVYTIYYIPISVEFLLRIRKK